jgi:hypothetical protein
MLPLPHASRLEAPRRFSEHFLDAIMRRRFWAPQGIECHTLVGAD